ncbi:hypothetical protein ACFQX6_28165 [Streptosporangium lutulentum]
MRKVDIFLPSLWSSRPTSVPSVRVSATVTAAKTTVLRSDVQNSSDSNSFW